MIKILCFIRRKPGFSMEGFRAYYEERHVPLILRLMPGHHDYRRNFVEDRPHVTGHMAQHRPQGADFDVLTELTYIDEAQYRQTLNALADPAIGPLIAADEARFMDRSTMCVVLVDERRS